MNEKLQIQIIDNNYFALQVMVCPCECLRGHQANPNGCLIFINRAFLRATVMYNVILHCELWNFTAVTHTTRVIQMAWQLLEITDAWTADLKTFLEILEYYQAECLHACQWFFVMQIITDFFSHHFVTCVPVAKRATVEQCCHSVHAHTQFIRVPAGARAVNLAHNDDFC